MFLVVVFLDVVQLACGSAYFLLEVIMNQDKYIKFVLTVIAFSLFFIALNLSVLEIFLYDLYDGKMEMLISGFSSRVDEFSSRIDAISSGIDDIVDAIKKR